ncbi:MAG: superfamily II DNA/RNA helicase [Flavobacteriaceae bacterium]|jgi:superfamily II DNA/RNA helicase|uniref:DEAD/DEAH box helicase n=1 Tax=Candidatus Marifrigoribacter sp. Uisw_064 TaxID=3230970 RepID=UPI003AE1E900
MQKAFKKRKEILTKLGIEKLNEMQEQATLAISSTSNIVLLSPTGTGKTLAFLLPIFEKLDPNIEGVQVLIIVPTRELALQIELVIRNMGSGVKVNALYGGRPFAKDLIDLNHTPTFVIGTPGRISDHIKRKTIASKTIKTLVLDEFDKSLEIGFESAMRIIVSGLTALDNRILTSATQGVEIPSFVDLINPVTVDFSEEIVSNLEMKSVISSDKDKLESLVQLICHIGNQPCIIFCNYKDTINWLSDFLTEKYIAHGCFYGGMDQKDRERALIKFRNGTHQILIATDLAARGIDVPEIQYIIHYQLPLKAHEFTHRNGRTARMNSNGTAYVLQWREETLPEYINKIAIEKIQKRPLPKALQWKTLFVSGGRKDKISKGDIAGLFFKKGNISKDELGVIELKQDCAFVAVASSKADSLIKALNNERIKSRKVRIYLV